MGESEAANASKPPPGNGEKLPVMRQLSKKAESYPRTSGNTSQSQDEAMAGADASY